MKPARATMGSRFSYGTGFTLVELIITMAIIGILALVAFPSYNDSKRKTRRADAAAAMLSVQVAQEKFRGSCAYYAQSLGTADTCGASASASTVKASSASAEGYYTISIDTSTATGNAYTIKAVAVSTTDQANDTGCTTLYIAFSSTYPSGNKTPAACWSK